MTSILISGASISAGSGLDNGCQDPKMFVNQLAVEILKSPMSQITNISISGIDNKRIFTDTALQLATNKYEYALVCWQGIPRINFEIGLEPYITTVCMTSPPALYDDINLVSGQKFQIKKLNHFKNYLLRYYNLHWEILDLVKYVNILQHIAQTHNTKLYFINYSLPWSPDYFNLNNWKIPSELSNFTQEILQAECRDDYQVAELYSLIHKQYSLAGGIREEIWLNLYKPLRDIQVDIISKTNKHPGYQSQDIFTNYLSPILQEKIRNIQ